MDTSDIIYFLMVCIFAGISALAKKKKKEKAKHLLFEDRNDCFYKKENEDTLTTEPELIETHEPNKDKSVNYFHEKKQKTTTISKDELKSEEKNKKEQPEEKKFNFDLKEALIYDTILNKKHF